ncbi:MAG: hypothetical protein M3217_04975, partial [Actinomycetota bacterium]|nr:hypothetical protein [Actinomycetota bacterium]
MRKSFAVILVVLAAACGGGGQEPRAAGGAASGPPATAPPDTASLDCPKLPRTAADAETAGLWPGSDARGLVPEIDGVCATPTTPYLFGLLNEAAIWAGDFGAAGLGVLHRGTDPLATFTVAELEEPARAFEQGAAPGGLVTTRVGDLTLAWGAAGDFVSVMWARGERTVVLSAA